MAVTYDPRKEADILAERNLRFEDATLVFAGTVFTFEDARRDYGERRFLSIGTLAGRMVVAGWTPRGEDRHVFTMRTANDREQRKYRAILGG